MIRFVQVFVDITLLVEKFLCGIANNPTRVAVLLCCLIILHYDLHFVINFLCLSVIFLITASKLKEKISTVKYLWITQCQGVVLTYMAHEFDTLCR